MSSSQARSPLAYAVRAALLLSATALSSVSFAETVPATSAQSSPLTRQLPEANESREVRIVEVFADSVAETSTNATDANDKRSGKPIEKKIKTYAWSSSSDGSMPLSFNGDLPDVNVIVSNALSQAFSTPGAGIFPGGRIVKNAPYSAEVVNERVQMLPDGNQITKRTSQLMMRDSAGRTRTEVRGENGETRLINIFDAVDGSRLTLSPASKVATKIAVDRDVQARIDELHEKAKAMAKEGKTSYVERNPGEEVIITRSDNSGKEAREEIKISVVRGAENRGLAALDSLGKLGHPLVFNSSGMAMLGSGVGAITTSIQDRTWSSKATTRELGSRDIDGVRAEGKMRSYTIPAGEIGNKNAITVTTETWISPDLQITVYSKHSDPRTGDIIYRLANVKRSEPSLSLFTMPDGYTLRETTPKIHKIRTK
jgi:hypothetical protein